MAAKVRTVCYKRRRFVVLGDIAALFSKTADGRTGISAHIQNNVIFADDYEPIFYRDKEHVVDHEGCLFYLNVGDAYPRCVGDAFSATRFVRALHECPCAGIEFSDDQYEFLWEAMDQYCLSAGVHRGDRDDPRMHTPMITKSDVSKMEEARARYDNSENEHFEEGDVSSLESSGLSGFIVDDGLVSDEDDDDSSVPSEHSGSSMSSSDDDDDDKASARTVPMTRSRARKRAIDDPSRSTEAEEDVQALYDALVARIERKVRKLQNRKIAARGFYDNWASMEGSNEERAQAAAAFRQMVGKCEADL
jgi:hypothetical protein